MNPRPVPTFAELFARLLSEGWPVTLAMRETHDRIELIQLYNLNQAAQAVN